VLGIQPLRERRWLLAVAASNLVGLLIDSVLFLQIAFGSLDFIEGQIIGKIWTTIFAVWCCWRCAAGSFRATAARPMSQPCRRSPRPARLGRLLRQRGPGRGVNTVTGTLRNYAG
jgi:hypothetical protein